MTRFAGVIAAVGLAGVWLWGQTASKAVVVNPTEDKWEHEKNGSGEHHAAAGCEDRRDGDHGAVSGRATCSPHWHESNERILVSDGELAVKQGDREVHVKRAAMRLTRAGDAVSHVHAEGAVYVLSGVGRQSGVA